MPLYTSTGAFNVALSDTTGTGRYSASGALRINLVSGASYVGLYAADGSMNVVDVSGVSISTYGGLYHPSGAIRGRAAPTTQSGVQAPDGSYYFNGLFSPIILFAEGEQGAWYDPSDFSTMFQDSAGTTPVTAVEQPVGKILDKSGRGNHASQSTSGSQPVLSARVNSLTYSEQFDNAAWTKSGLAATPVIANTVVAPNGLQTADKIVESTATGGHYIGQSVSTVANTPYVFRAYVKAVTAGASFERGFVMIQSSFTTNNVYGTINLSNGATNLLGGTGTLNAVDVGDGWWRVSLTATPSATASASFNVWTATDATTFSYTGDGTSGIYLWGADVRATNDGVGLPAYQRVAAATDYDTSGFPLYLKFDGTDDSLSTSSIDPGAVDKMQLFAGIRKLSDAVVGIVAEFSANGGTNNGIFILTAPNDAANANYGWYSKGTGLSQALVSPYAAPITHVITGIGDIASDTALLRLNGTQVGTSATDQGTGNYGNHPLYIGRRGNATLPYNGRLYSMIVRFSAANLSDAQIASTETWVNGKTKGY